MNSPGCALFNRAQVGINDRSLSTTGSSGGGHLSCGGNNWSFVSGTGYPGPYNDTPSGECHRSARSLASD